MKKKFKAQLHFGFVFTLLLMGGLGGQFAKAQTLPVGLLKNVEDQYRRQQLIGADSLESSYLIRPIQLPAASLFKKQLYQNEKGNLKVFLLPLVLQQQFNGHHPFGSNDNSMVAAKGYQAMVSGGFYAEAGPLRIQLRPEYVYAANSSFATPETVGNHLYYAYPNLVYNRIDNPSRFVNEAYQKGSWGQSSIRLNFDPISFGLSTESLWWGPGIKNSLLMSNNAPGFKHLTLNTTKPVDISIGKIEAQIIAGRLEDSGVAMPLAKANTNYTFLAKPDNWRSIAGLVFTYQPKWVPGLYLGFDRTAVAYHNATDSATTFSSFFGRFVLPESHAEVYFQVGQNKHTPNDKGSRLASTAYVAGFNKLVPLKATDQYIQVAIEFSQLEAPRGKGINVKPSWYTDVAVMQGYTNKGQVIGAGIGPGGNMQSLDLNWVKGFKQIGFGIERIVNNNDFFYGAGLPIGDVRRHWVDLAFKGNVGWNFDKLIINAELAYVNSLNYQWQLIEDGSFYWNVPRVDAANFHAKIGLMYNF